MDLGAEHLRGVGKNVATGPCPMECMAEVRPGWWQPGRTLGIEPRAALLCFCVVLLSIATHDRGAIIAAITVAFALVIVFRKMSERDPRSIEIRLRGISRYRERTLRAEALARSPRRRHERRLL